MRNFAALVLGLIVCLAALPASGNVISIVSLLGEVEASINDDPMSVFLTQPGTVSITRDDGNEYAFASLTVGYSTYTITVDAFADVDHPFQTGFSSAGVTIEFSVDQWVDMAFLNLVLESAIYGGVPLSPWVKLSQDGNTLWVIDQVFSYCTDLPSPPLSCSLLSPGTYSLRVDSIAVALDACPNCAEHSLGIVELVFAPCYDLDGDGVCVQIDNCPNVSNPAQTDADGDEQGDVCDCAPSDPLVQSASDPIIYSTAKNGDVTVFQWRGWPGGLTYDVFRGSVSELPPGILATCMASGLNAARFDEAEAPLPGDAYFYLIRGSNPDCGPGPIGYDSFGNERDDTALGACP